MMKPAFAVAALLLLLPAVSRADDPALADEHARRAKANVIAGHLPDAITEYDLAFRASPQGKYLYNIAELHRRLAEAGSVEELRSSRDFFLRYLEVQPHAQDRTQVEARIVELRAKIESAEAAGRETSVRSSESSPSKEGAAPTQSGTGPQLIVEDPLEPTKPSIYKKWWFWASVVGGVVVASGAVTLAVALTTPNEPSVLQSLR